MKISCLWRGSTSNVPPRRGESVGHPHRPMDRSLIVQDSLRARQLHLQGTSTEPTKPPRSDEDML